MKVSLIDLDINKHTRRKFPNLALMKLAAYHKQRGDQVNLNSLLERPDRVYASAVFSWHRKAANGLPENSIIGGPAWSDGAGLAPEIEHIMPDYSLYPELDFSIGFTSRGCIRHCRWCKVPELEGGIRATASFLEFWDRRHSRVLLLDNNLLAAPNCADTLRELSNSPVEVDFNQGLDIRLLTDFDAALLARIRTAKLRFAFDNLAYESSVREGIKLLDNAGIKRRHLSFYVLVGFPGDESWLERMKLMASFNVDVYPMIYRDEDGTSATVTRETVPNIFWHGARANITKFLSVAGRIGGRGVLGSP